MRTIQRCQFVFCFYTEIPKRFSDKSYCETDPEMKLLSIVMDFRNVPVIFGVTAVILLAVNGKW